MYKFKTTIIFVLAICLFTVVHAQSDSSGFFQRKWSDTTDKKLNMDAVYNRPFLTLGKFPVAIGGYLEANTHYEVVDGVTNGFSFQARRFTLFLSSSIAHKIRFFSELEFENGTKEINIEFAALDFEFHPLLILRSGIVMNPIGAYNQNHDGPRWDFIERPLVATDIVPTTLSNVGFGVYGKYYVNKWVLGYETYLTNGFDDRIVSNTLNRSSLSEGKINPERFSMSNSGLPMFTAKMAVRNRSLGELGLSFMSGVYNKWQEDGLRLDQKRSASVFALDFNTSLFRKKLDITGEFSKVLISIPETYDQTFGDQQAGGFLDLVCTMVEKPMLGWEKAKINFGVRLEYVDFNQGKFKETNGNIGDHVWAMVPSLAFRPMGTTVLRLNYRFIQETDLLGNPPIVSGVLQFGFSSYF
ncbi:MAG: hypothetical protein IPM48_10345 [Saprospiraceae bacterium]|nr:hypothetical protein [Saprospiraceae bacterium]